MNSINRRFIVFTTIIALLALALLTRYALLMLKDSPLPEPRSRALAERGPILDANGRFLAMQTRLANISVWRPEIHNNDIEALAAELAPLLEMPGDEIVERIAGAPSDFVYIKKQVNESTARLVNAARAEGKIRGVSAEPIMGRVYPEKTLASQLVGFVGDENNGLAGIEYVFDDVLAGTGNGGSAVVLTIDANVQHILERIAAGAMTENQAEGVMLLAMDPRSGDILGSVSLPGFDPNDIRTSTETGRMDRPAIWAYEPGSVFKVFSLAALLDSGVITGNTTFVCNGRYERVTSRGERIQINCLGVHGRVGLREIIIHSCNAGAAYASDQLGNSAFYELLRDFGFGSRTGAGNPGETAGFLRQADRWSERSKPTIAMGQEIAVSALQMIQAAGAIANDGILVPPRLVSRIVSADGKTAMQLDGAATRRVLKPETARAMRSYMVDVTSSIGTGWRAAVEDLSLAVKTGTAQIIDPETRAYSDTDFIASCVALLPAESPSLILYLAIIKPRGEILGGRIAAPAIREAADALVDYLGIPRGRNLQTSHAPAITLPRGELPPLRGVVPNFTGIAKRTLLPLLENDIRVEIRGDGWVRRQSPPPGTPLAADTVIVLELE